MIHIGIDPGLHGAIAMIDHLGAHIEDMPVADGSVDPAGLAHILDNFHDGSIQAYVERVGAMPAALRGRKQGNASAFKFGTGFGMILGVLAALEIPYTLVTPASWKKEFSLGRDKDESRARALQLFPSQAGNLSRVKDDGRAEALLIAEYGRRKAK